MCRRRRLSSASPTSSKNWLGTGRLAGLMIFTRFSSALASASPVPSIWWMRSSSGCRWRLITPSESSSLSSWCAISSEYSSRSLNHRPGSSCFWPAVLLRRSGSR